MCRCFSLYSRSLVCSFSLLSHTKSGKARVHQKKMLSFSMETNNRGKERRNKTFTHSNKHTKYVKKIERKPKERRKWRKKQRIIEVGLFSGRGISILLVVDGWLLCDCVCAWLCYFIHCRCRNQAFPKSQCQPKMCIHLYMHTAVECFQRTKQNRKQRAKA